MSRSRSALLVLEETTAGATADGSVIHRLDILKNLLEQDVKQEHIEGIEYVNPTKWFIVFTTEYLRAAHLGYKVETKGYKGTLSHPNPPKAKPNTPKSIHVHVTGYPLDSDIGFLLQAMRFYGNVIDIKELVDSRCDIKTGVRDVVFSKIDKPIASYIYAGKHQVRCNYPGQVQTCRKCHRSGHIARECTATNVCRACGEEGHQKGTCPNQPCYFCHELGHLQRDCPQYMADFPGMDTTPAPEADQQPEDATDDVWRPQPWTEPDADPNADPHDWGPSTAPPVEQTGPMQDEQNPPAKAQAETSPTPTPSEPQQTSVVTSSPPAQNREQEPPPFKVPLPKPPPPTVERQRTPIPSPCSSASATPTPSGDESTNDEMETDTAKRGEKRTAGPNSPKGRKQKSKSKRQMKVSQAKNRSPFLKKD